MSAPKSMSALESGVHHGIEWAIVRAPMFGAVNGYVPGQRTGGES